MNRCTKFHWLIFSFILISGEYAGIARADPLGTTFYFVDGATDEEVEQATPALRLQPTDQMEAFRIYSDVILQHPHNRAARLLRLQMLLHAGFTEFAERELLYLQINHPDFPGVMEAEATLAHLRADTKREAVAWRTLADRGYAKSQFANLLAGRRCLAAIRALELEGKPAEALAAMKAAIEDRHSSPAMAGSTDLAELLLRQGDFTGAAKAFDQEVQRDRTAHAQRAFLASDLSNLSIALLASGHKRESLARALEAMKSTTEAEADRDTIAERILFAHMLTASGTGTPADEQEAARFLLAAAKSCSPRHPSGLSSIVPAILDPALRHDAIQRIAAILKAAPGLDWALWAALFLAQSDPSRAGELLNLLPANSVQARLAR